MHHMAIVACVLSIIGLTAAFVMLRGYGNRLTAIEQALTALENSRQPNATSFAGNRPLPAAPQPVRRQSPLQTSSARSPASPLTLSADPQDPEQRQLARLANLQADFERERVDNSWAVQTESDVRDILTYATASSGLDLGNSTIRCRSSSCKIQVDLPPGVDPEDMLLQLSVGMTELLPRSKIVALPDGKGGKRLSIFATR